MADAVTRIESAISNRDLEQAAALAARMESLAASAGPAEKAAAFYYAAVTGFLAGNRDRETEAALTNALGLYSRENDVEGVWSSLYLLQKLYFDFDRNNSDLWTRVASDLNAVEKQVIRVRLGLAPDSGDDEILEKLFEDKSLGALKRNLDEVYSRLSTNPVHGEKIRQEQETWRRHVEKDLGLFRLGSNLKSPRLQYYLESREKLQGVAKKFSLRAAGSVRARLEKLARIETTLALSSNRRGSDSVVEGFNPSGGRWAYEFIEHSIEPTMDLATDSAGAVLFADSEFVVRSVELVGSWEPGFSKSKTELSFYNTKTCRLIALVSVPNRVFKVGRIGDSRGGRFYVGTITPAKYLYDDCPLAITLVDLETESIERIPVISDDYWLALGHELGIQASAGSLRFTVDKGTLSQYVRTQPEKEVFKETHSEVPMQSSPRTRWNAE